MTSQSAVLILYDSSRGFFGKILHFNQCIWHVSYTLPEKNPCLEARQEMNSQRYRDGGSSTLIPPWRAILGVFFKVLWHRWDISHPWLADGTSFSLLPMKCFHITVDSVDFQWPNALIQDLRFLRQVANSLNTFMLLLLGQAIRS